MSEPKEAEILEERFMAFMERSEGDMISLDEIARFCASGVHRFLSDALCDFYLERLEYDPLSLSLDSWARVQDKHHSSLKANVKAVSLITDYLPGTGGKIIDIGCNDGGLVKELVGLGHDCYGVDLPMVIAKAQLKRPDIAERLSVCNLECDELPGGPYELALALAVIEHLRNYGLFLGKVSAVLKPGGILYISTSNRKYRRTAPYHTHHFTEDEFSEMAAQAGLTPLRYDQINSETNLTAIFKKTGNGVSNE